MTDHDYRLRQAVVSRLRADVTVSGFVAARVWDTVPGGEADKRPYLKYGVPLTVPFEADLVAGSQVDVTIHVHDEYRDTSRVYRIMAAVQESLAEASFAITGTGELWWMTWTGKNLIEDQAPKNYHHGVVEFQATLAEA